MPTGCIYVWRSAGQRCSVLPIMLLAVTPSAVVCRNQRRRTVGLPISLADGETRLITNLSSTTINEQKSESPLLSWLPCWARRGTIRRDASNRLSA